MDTTLNAHIHTHCRVLRYARDNDMPFTRLAVNERLRALMHLWFDKHSKENTTN